jgi:peroxiredoxin
MYKKLVILFLLFPTLMQAGNNRFKISGRIGSLNSPVKVFLSYRDRKTPVVDSASVKNGSFAFKGDVSGLIYASLILVPDGKGLRSPQAKSVRIYVEPGKTSVLCTDNFEILSIKGGPANTDLEKLRLAMKPSKDKMEAMNMEAKAWTEEQRENEDLRSSFGKKFNLLYEETRSIQKDFVHANPGSLICPDVLSQIGGSFPEYSELWPLFSKLSEANRTSQKGKDFESVLLKVKNLSLGSVAPDFAQPTPEGKLLKISDFRGKYLLIDFWASWCGPCRAENPKVVQSYNKFHPRNFEILGVSLDQPNGRDAWLKAIEKDNLTWPQVSDLKYWENEAAQLYYVRGIPMNYLLDPEGKIIAKNLRGKALEDKLAELLD